MKRGLVGLAVIIGIIASGINNGAEISSAIKADIQIIDQAAPIVHIAEYRGINADGHSTRILIHDGLDPT